MNNLKNKAQIFIENYNDCDGAIDNITIIEYIENNEYTDEYHFNWLFDVEGESISYDDLTDDQKEDYEYFKEFSNDIIKNELCT